MKLDCIWDTEKEKNDYPAIKDALIKKFGVEKMYDIRLANICETYEIRNGYGTNTYTGVLKKDNDVSEIELAMICDSGYSFFGGSSVIRNDRSFEVKIWFD